jgi:AcrR family transcriptional regulator
MVQKEAKRKAEAKRRGRPRAYDRDTALDDATGAFWRAGYSGTSLDALAASTGMQRPSLYAAFGDKRALYLQALDRYWQLADQAMDVALAGDRPLAEALMRVYQTALQIYFPAKGRARGCFAIGTATTEAMEDAKIRELFADGLRNLDRRLEARMRAARESGELAGKADPEVLSLLASAILHTLAIRARAGVPRPELEKLARKAVATICGVGR